MVWYYIYVYVCGCTRWKRSIHPAETNSDSRIFLFISRTHDLSHNLNNLYQTFLGCVFWAYEFGDKLERFNLLVSSVDNCVCLYLCIYICVVQYIWSSQLYIPSQSTLYIVLLWKFILFMYIFSSILILAS